VQYNQSSIIDDRMMKNHETKRFFETPVWKILVGPRYSHCKYLFLILIPNILSAVLEGGTFALILLAFSALEGKLIQDYHFPAWVPLISWLQSLNSSKLFYFFILSAIGFQAFRGLVSFVSFYGTSLLSLKVQTAAQKQVYHQIFKFSFPFVSQYKVGDLNEYVKGPSVVIPILFDALNRFIAALFMIFGLLAVLFWISPNLTLFTLFFFGLFSLIQKVVLKKIGIFSEQLSKHLFELSHQTVQALQGLRPIHIFHRHGFMLNKVSDLLGRIVKCSKRTYFWNNIIPTMNETVNVLLVGGILIIGSCLLAHRNNGEAISNLLTYIILTYRLATRSQICMTSLGSVGVWFGSVKRINEILDDQDKEFLPQSGKELKEWFHQIDFYQVSLRYPKSTKLALDEVSFSIKKGQTVAFVGLSGAGKSSVLDLILGLHAPTGGEILVDSQCLSSFSHESWRERIGVVSQDIFLFNETIEENIRFGDERATHQQIERAAVLAGISDLIEHLPNGYQTLIGERGYRLSGGERQRIALARALLKNPEILILDEATSCLDSLSEQLIQESIQQMQKSKTVIMVAHRLSSVIHANQIIVLEKGRVVEIGSHHELMALNSRYGQLWKFQAGRASCKTFGRLF
jgi:ATP-binding cassette, subfamily B, bacterial MsbA